MVQLGFSMQLKYDRSHVQIIELLRDAGFSAVSPVWSPELPWEDIVAWVQKLGMTIQSVHTPHGGQLYLWNTQDPQSAITQKKFTDCIDTCAQFGIPIAVMHGWQGLQYTFPDAPLDFSAFDRIVDYAEERKVTIAFENLEGEEYLQALMTRYRDRPYIGYCWDSGHDHCYPHKMDFLKAFGDRLVMTHIHDNFGTRDPGGVPTTLDDLHLLPYDGRIHWESAIGRLRNLPEQRILNFELKKLCKSPAPEDRLYAALSTQEYFRLAAQRARRIADLYENIMNNPKQMEITQ